MQNIFQRQIVYSGRLYKISFDFDDEAIMENCGTFRITGSSKKQADESANWDSVSLDGLINFEERTITISKSEETIAVISLDTELPDSDDFYGEANDFEAEGEVINSAIGETSVEHLIELVPTDPFFGCLIRGALSTAVGQIIRCYNRVRSNASSVERLLTNIGGCLKEHSLKMTFTFLWRSGKCVITAGAPSL